MQAYTILESSTMSVFLHVTTSEPPAPYWGNILKSNSNGTYYGLSMDNVNRNDAGYVDFEKMIGLDGIALVNVVSNPHEAPLTKRKLLQTRITHNDGQYEAYMLHILPSRCSFLRRWQLASFDPSRKGFAWYALLMRLDGELVLVSFVLFSSNTVSRDVPSIYTDIQNAMMSAPRTVPPRFPAC